jgi:glycosyltransferase involved in cell wall biosynthesis
MVGTVEPRKGHAQALAAFELLWAQGSEANLVIVGKQGWLVDELVAKLRQHPELNQHLFWLEGISDEYLEAVYAASTCLIAPSEGEGFGLPLIEAALHKKPMIARDLPVFGEVAGEHAFYFSGLAPKDLVDAIIAWLALSQKNLHPKSEGIPYLSWQESALQLKEQLPLNAVHLG